MDKENLTSCSPIVVYAIESHIANKIGF